MKLLNKFSIALLVFSTLLISCDKEDIVPNPDGNLTEDPGDDPIEEPTYTTPVGFDISDAICLVQIENPQTKAVYGANGNGSSNFYKITGNGKFLKISLLDKDGEETTDTAAVIDVVYIWQLNEDFFVLYGSFSWLDEDSNRVSYTSLLVNSQDGALYDFGGGINNKTFRYLNKEFRSDNDGNIYYFGTNGDDDLQKLTIGNNGEITRTKVMPGGQNPGYLEIDKAGNLMYCNDWDFFEGRMIPITGGIIPLELENEDHDYRGAWVGKNGKIHLALLPRENNENNDVFIYELGVSDGTVDYTETGYAYNEMDNMNFDQVFYTNDIWRIEQESSFIFIRKDQPGIIQVADDAMEYIKPIPFTGDIEMAAYSENYFFCAKDTKLLRISLDDFSIDELLPANSFDIYNISLGASDTLTVSALRFSDAKKVYFDLSPDGKIQILDESSGTTAVSLVRLN